MPAQNFRWLRGAALFGFIHLSLVVLVLNPILPNPWGERQDQKLLADVDARIAAARKGPIRITLLRPDGRPAAETKIVYCQTRHDFIFGGNLFLFRQFPDPAAQENYLEDFKRLFNLAVIPFYWSTYEPQPGVFPEKKRLAEMIAWCEANDITVKGHPLAWRNPAGYPAWLPADPNEVTKLLQGRIQNVVAEFRGQVKIWDAVNEPTHLPTFGALPTFDYVRDALSRAHAADPNALLSVNDYGILGHDRGRGPYYRLLQNLIASNAPLGSIGFEGHEPRTDWIPAREIQASLDAYSSLGRPLFITELTIPSAELPITNSWKKGVWTEAAQAEYLERFYKICFSHPAVSGVIYWDLSDRDAWVRNSGLLKANGEQKPAYESLARLFNTEWHTEGTGTTDAQGEIEFTGFYGKYEIVAPATGARFAINAPRGQTNSFRLTLTAPALPAAEENRSAP